jgi:small-conductance mechanosensitive channel
MLLFFWTLEIWNIGFPVGETVVKTVVMILLVVLLCYLAWGLINAAIQRRMQREIPEIRKKMRPTKRAAPAARASAPCLCLLRKFMLVVIIVMASLIVLSALGVHIGPLIAGAGVFGLAIGFGAQTLVKDIISGVFFLMDDAFPGRRLSGGFRHQGNGGAHFAAFPQAAHPRGMVYFHPLRRHEDGDQPQPRLCHHEARLSGAL